MSPCQETRCNWFHPGFCKLVEHGILVILCRVACVLWFGESYLLGREKACKAGPSRAGGSLDQPCSLQFCIFPLCRNCSVFTTPVAAVPNLFGTRDRFRGRQFFHGLGRGSGDGSGGDASDGERQMKLHSLAPRSPPAVRPGS